MKNNMVGYSASPRDAVPVILVAISGFLAATGILVAPLWFCTPLGLALFIYMVWKRTVNAGESLLFGAVFGFLTAGAGLLSLWEIVPPDQSADISMLFAAGLLWLVPTFALGAVSIPFAYLLFRTKENAFAPLIAVGALVLHEYLRMWVWMVVTYGKGASTEPHLSITALGYAFADSPYFLQVAGYGGLLALTVLLGVSACALACLFGENDSRTGRAQRIGSLLAFALIVTSPLFSPKEEHQVAGTRTIAVFATNSGPHGDTGDSTALPGKVATAPLPDIILLPEGKSLETVLSTLPDKNAFDRWFKNGRDVLIVHSSESTGQDGVRHNTVSYESTQAGPLARQHKVFLMPEGEYLPYLSQVFLSWFSGAKLGNIPKDKAVAHGDELVAVPFKGAVFGTLLCSELFSPFLYERLARAHGATVLVNLADPQWFRGSHILYRKALQIAKVHAVESRSYFLAAQNSAPSFVIDPRGRVVAETSWGQTDALFFSLPVENP